jgi:hypothetical protein
MSAKSSALPGDIAVNGAAEPLLLSPEQVREQFQAFVGAATAHFQSQALYAVARLGVADAIGSGRCTIDAIAERIGARAIRKDALHRCMRLLAAQGFFEEEEAAASGPGSAWGEATYRLTPLGALLQTSVSAEMQPSLSCMVLHLLEPPMWKAWMSLPDYVAGTSTSPTAWETANGMPLFDY